MYGVWCVCVLLPVTVADVTSAKEVDPCKYALRSPDTVLGKVCCKNSNQYNMHMKAMKYNGRMVGS
jgi:hypothetical protein